MTAIVLTNFYVVKKPDKHGHDYYLIVDNDTNKTYFAFQTVLTRREWKEISERGQDLQLLAINFETNQKGLNRVLALKFADVYV